MLKKIAVLMVLGGLVLPAWAAEPMLDEIIVSAQKRDENIQDVPLSVSAIGEETLKFKNIADLNEAQAYLPNVNIIASNTFNFIWMRGLGSDYNKGFEQSVGILIDGVSLGRAAYLTGGLLDLAAIEVLRGPQGTLYGKNTIAGALHLKTGQPDFEFGGNTELLGGEFAHMRARAMLTGPLFGDTIAFRAAASYDKADGVAFNETRGIDQGDLNSLNGRFKLRARNDWLDAVLSVEGASIKDNGPRSELYAATEDVLALYQTFDARTEDDVFNGKKQMDAPSFSDKDILSAVLTADVSMGDYTLTSISAYAQLDEDVAFDADMGPIPVLEFTNNEDFSQFTQELRLTSPLGERFDFVAGAYFSWSELYAFADAGLLKDDVGGTLIDQLAPAAASGVLGPVGDAVNLIVSGAASGLGAEGFAENNIQFIDQVQTGGAVFGQANWHWNDWLTLIGGVRVSYDEKDVQAELYLTGSGLLFPSAVPGTEEFNETRSRAEWDVSPKASVKVAFDGDIMGFVTVARGFKSGGFNASASNASQLEFESETSWTYEAGVKADFLSGAARVNAGIFRTEFSDLQVSAFNGFSFVVENAASAISQGLEVEGWLALSENLMFNFSGALLDATYDSFPGGPCSATSGEEAPCDQTGETLPYAPEWSGAVGFIYQQPLGNLPFHMVLSADLTFSDFIYFTVDHDPIDSSEAYGMVNARIGFADVDERWSFLVYVDNVTDEDVLASSDDTPLFPGTHFGGAYAPRTVEAEFRVYF